MTVPSQQNDWEFRYQTGQTGWDRGKPSPVIQHWLNRGELTTGNVLIPGCGRGYEVIQLAKLGFEVTAIDFASSAVKWLRAKLREENISASVIQSDLLEWTTEESFDAIYEQTCLCALEPSQWQTYAEKIHQWLKPGGKLYALFMQTHKAGGPPFHCDIGEMHQLFPEALWNWNSEFGRKVPHPVGYEEIAFVLEKI